MGLFLGLGLLSFWAISQSTVTANKNQHCIAPIQIQLLKKKIYLKSVNISGLAYSPSGDFIAAASLNNQIMLFNHDLTGQKILSKSQFEPKDIAISPDSKKIVSLGTDGSILVWNTQGKKLASFFAGPHEVNSLTIGPSGKKIALGHGNFVHSQTSNYISIWTIKGKRLQKILGHKGRINQVDYSTEGHLLSASQDGTVRVWDTNGKPLAMLYKHQSPVYTARFSPDSRRIWSGGQKIIAWDWKNSNTVFSIDKFRHIITHNINKKKIIEDATKVHSIAVSPNGCYWATGSSDLVIRIWSRQGRLLTQIAGQHWHENIVLAFSPDSRNLVSSSWDRQIRLWRIH